ncbi:hypothetical protein G6F35_018994 [Rhizopus arrhizus]|nr:hypothetical protein G6F35_018994 [Rhizopus arrhizus]
MGALHRRPGRHPAAGQAGHAGQGLPLHRYPEWRDRHALVPAGDPQRLRAGQRRGRCVHRARRPSQADHADLR